MAIFETFSKRKKRLAMARQQDVFQYDDLPAPFRRQVFHIWKNALGGYYVPRGYSSGHPYATNQYWDFIHDTIATEAGLFYLANKDNEKNQRCYEYMLNASTDDALSIIELSFRVIDKVVRDRYGYLPDECGVVQQADEAIEELNHRLKEHAIGYQYVDGILVRIDSQFLHAEIVKPALSLLGANGFEGPADEFIRAFDHYRHGRNKEAVAEALKSFESTMKSICAARNWKHSSVATAKQLMDILFDKGLIPTMLESHFRSLRAAMESGLPTLRNKTSGHGQGPSPVELPNHFVAYALHLTAANIVFLVEAQRALK
jgi:uncharacterized protein DUF7014/AbiJ-like protein